MIYKVTLETGEQIYLANDDPQTRVRVQGGDANHQESQNTSFETGKWKTTPRIFQTSKGAVIQLQGDSAQVSLELHDGALNRLENPPEFDESKAIKLEKTDEFPASPELKPMEPMKPMEPLKPMKPLS